MKIGLIILIYLLSFNLVFSQSTSELNSYLSEIAIGNSKQIRETEKAKKIFSYGTSILPKLAEFFTDTTLSNIYSECNTRILTKGEVAIILADRIEMMPFNKLTGIQNCLLTFCDKNPNLIEYYIDDIKRDGREKFKENYIAWLKSRDRKSWAKHLSTKDKN